MLRLRPRSYSFLILKSGIKVVANPAPGSGWTLLGIGLCGSVMACSLSSPLVLTPPTPSYRCFLVLSFWFHSNLSNLFTFVFHFSVKPEFGPTPKSLIALEGSNLTIPCYACGVPEPTISWTFRNASLEKQHRLTRNGLTLLFIENNPSYEGNYTCYARNRAGRVEETVQLTIDCE